MAVRLPAPLITGGRIAVTAPSSGVPTALRSRLDSTMQRLREAGYDVVAGASLDGHDGIVSAPAAQRAAELTAMICDPTIAVVVAACGGELAVEVLPHLDFEVLAGAPPPWIVGFSDISTLLLPLTLLTNTATLHADNLIDSLPGVPSAPLASWLDAVTSEAKATITQAAPNGSRPSGNLPKWWQRRRARTLNCSTHNGPPGTRLPLKLESEPLHVAGRLIGGCLDTVSVLAGTRYGDVAAFAAAHAPEGLIIYLETAEHPAVDVARDLWRLRLTGWFDAATAILIGRTTAPDSPGLTQHQAVTMVVGDLGIPIITDLQFGHVPPQLALINGALAELTADGSHYTLRQHLSAL